MSYDLRIIFAFFFLVQTSCKSKLEQQTKPLYNEASLKTFVFASHSMTETEVVKQLDSILINASVDSIVFHKTISFLEKPLSDPNSSYRNQNLYSKLLHAEIESNWFSDYEKKIAAAKIKLLEQNNVGNPANDFTYITPAGYKKRMYDIGANFLLLYFNNPECNACKEMKQALSASAIINKKIKSGELKILSIYTDKDEKRWLDHLAGSPDNWIQGRDEDEYLYKNKIYDLKAIPTVYLIDKEKIVLLKDCLSIHLIEECLVK